MLVSFTGTTRELAPDEEDERQVGRADLDLALAPPAAAICRRLSVGGYMSSSSVASAGWRPCSATSVFWSGSASWSAACNSTVIVMVSTGRAGDPEDVLLAPPAVPAGGAGAARWAKVRFIVSGLNWKTMTRLGWRPRRLRRVDRQTRPSGGSAGAGNSDEHRAGHGTRSAAVGGGPRHRAPSSAPVLTNALPFNLASPHFDLRSFRTKSVASVRPAGLACVW